MPNQLAPQPLIIRHEPAAECFTSERCFINELSNTPGDEALSIATARVAPGVTTRWHHLIATTERYVILAGQGMIEMGDLPAQLLTALDVAIIPPGCKQRITNRGTTDLWFLAICTPRFMPAAYVESDDVEIDDNARNESVTDHSTFNRVSSE